MMHDFLVYLQLKINKVLKTSQITKWFGFFNMLRNLFYTSGCLIILDFKWVCKHTDGSILTHWLHGKGG